MSFLSPNQQCQSTEGKNITFHGLAHPKITWGLPTLSLTNSSWLPWGRVAMPLISPLMPVARQSVTSLPLQYSFWCEVLQCRPDAKHWQLYISVKDSSLLMFSLQCFDTVGLATPRASGLWDILGPANTGPPGKWLLKQRERCCIGRQPANSK